MTLKVARWIPVKRDLPSFGDVVVCTDGKHRWLDMRIAGTENLIWQGHLATHWLPIPDLSPLLRDQSNQGL